MPCQRGALKELDYGPPARRIGDVSAGAQDTYVEAACRRASPARGMSSGPPAAPCRSAECKEYLLKIGALCGKVALRPSVMNPARDKLEALNLASRCIRLHTYHGQSCRWAARPGYVKYATPIFHARRRAPRPPVAGGLAAMSRRFHALLPPGSPLSPPEVYESIAAPNSIFTASKALGSSRGWGSRERHHRV